MGTTAKVSHQVPGLNSRASVQFLHGAQHVKSSKQNNDLSKKHNEIPEIIQADDYLLHSKKQIHRAAFNYSMQETSGDKKPHNGQALAQSVIGKSNTNLIGMPQSASRTGKLSSKFALDLKGISNTH
jgi:hypothetical protein